MPPAVSEEDLQALQADNEKLRERLEKAHAKRGEQEAAREREYNATMLAAENLRLQAAVEAAEDAAKVGSTKSGVATVQGSAEAQLAQAKAVLEAPTGRQGEPSTQPVTPQPDKPGPDESNGGN
jgi:hypothetical protein